MVERDTTSGRRWADWVARALTAGFFATAVATAVLLTAHWIAASLGSDSADAPALSQWMYRLAYNEVTGAAQTYLPLAILLHFLAGIAWAIVYAAFAEQRLPGPAWLRGMQFSLAPWLLSLLVFLPLAGGGFLGLAIGAGPLPIVGNLILHLVYGFTLGEAYLTERDRPLVEREERADIGEHTAMVKAGHTMGAGIVAGLVLGAVVGLLIGWTLLTSIGPVVLLLAGALLGSAVGALVGGFLGLPSEAQ